MNSGNIYYYSADYTIVLWPSSNIGALVCYSVFSPQNRVLLTKSPNFQDSFLLGYRCAPWGHDFLFRFLDTFLHLLNVTAGTINSAINSNIYAFDRELNSTPSHSARNFKLGFVCATIELLISFNYNHSVQLKVLFLILLFQLVRSSSLLYYN